MQKQPLSLENILTDLRLMAKFNMQHHSPVLLAAAGFFLQLTIRWFIFLWFLPLPGIVLGAISVFFGIRYAREHRPYRADIKALRAAFDRANISISIEEFSHTEKEVVVEPHMCGSHAHLTDLAFMVYFTSGNSWRKPPVTRLYEWSKTHHLTFEGLDNISLTGDEFYYISLQGAPNVSFIYPCKFFTLTGELEDTVKQKAQ